MKFLGRCSPVLWVFEISFIRKLRGVKSTSSVLSSHCVYITISLSSTPHRPRVITRQTDTPLLCLSPLGWQVDMLYLSTDLTTTAMCLSVSGLKKGSSNKMPLSLVRYQDNVKMQFIWRSNSYQHIINTKIQLLSRHNLPAICNFNYQNQIVSQVWLQPFTGGSLEQNTRKFMFKKIINLLRWATQRLCQAGF